MIRTIGIIREGKTPPDRRVPLTPSQCKKLMEEHPKVEVIVQRSPIRVFEDMEYEKAGVKLVDNVQEADALFGVKEVNVEDLIPDKTYFFFSHTTKMQPYNRNLLKAVLDKRIKLVDYEELRNSVGRRIIGFGRYAGIVGCYNGFLAYGERTGAYQLKKAENCYGLQELLKELSKVKLPDNFKIVLTGTGRVANGAMEILEHAGVQRVRPKELLTEEFEKPVFAQISVGKYNKRKDGGEFSREDFYANPQKYESDFYKYAKVADMFVAGHFWDSKAPSILTKEELEKEDLKIKVVADISCDIKEPIASTIRPSTIADPIYGYSRKTHSEVKSTNSPEVLTVMAVDNLPCELPKDASEGFGEVLLEKVIPSLLRKGETIERATIAEGGKLKPRFQYLQDFVDQE